MCQFDFFFSGKGVVPSGKDLFYLDGQGDTRNPQIITKGDQKKAREA